MDLLISGLTEIYRGGGNVADAVKVVEVKLEVMKRRGTFQTPDGAGLFRSIGIMKFAQGHIPGAMNMYEESRNIMSQTGTLQTPDGAGLLRKPKAMFLEP